MVQTIVQAISEKIKTMQITTSKKLMNIKINFALDVEYKTSLSKCKSTEIVYGGIMLSDIYLNVTILNIYLHKVFLQMLNQLRKTLYKLVEQIKR